MARLEPLLGRYLRMTFQGQEYRVYFEEAGQGLPLVCLHTAGADGRQYRHLMNDPEVTQDFRVIAFDLPWHGKSNPPQGWWEQEYRLTAQYYADFVMQFCQEMGLERPIIMGCSMGGKIVLELALRYAQRIRALIGLEAADYQEPWYDREWLDHPHTNSSEVCASLIEGLMAPQSPPEHRWEIWWMYAQSAPGVFKGDLHFYRVEGDYRGRLAGIDTDQCPLYLLTGEYDFSCTPRDTRRTARQIPGCQVTIMKRLGHFPMGENPAHFKGYLMPILRRIRVVAAPQRRGPRLS